MKEIKGNIITLAKEGHFDIIIQGCNCFCRMGSGLAPQIKENFLMAWAADVATTPGDITKLGNYTIGEEIVHDKDDQPNVLKVINIYSQYGHDPADKPLDYEALTLALRKVNFEFKGLSIACPQIGAGRAMGDWDRIKYIIETELKDMVVTIVYFDEEDKW